MADLLAKGVMQSNYGAKNEKMFTECCICMNHFQDEDMITSLPCNPGHYFHTECIVNWVFLGKRSCPLCRVPLVKDQIERFQAN